MRAVYLASDPERTPGVVVHEAEGQAVVWWATDIVDGEWVSEDHPFRDRWYDSEDLAPLRAPPTRLSEMSQVESPEIQAFELTTKLDEDGCLIPVRDASYRRGVPGPQIQSAEDVYELFEDLGNKDVEHIVMVMLNVRGELLGWQVVHKGHLAAVEASPRKMLEGASLLNAHSVIMLHNHPSGSPGPSGADEELTAHVAKIAQQWEMPLIDHVIIGRERNGQEPYFSFSEQRLLREGEAA